MQASTAFYINSTDSPGGTSSPLMGASWLGSGQGLDAEAIFTISGNNLTIELINLITNQGTDGQSISGISFNVSSYNGTPSSTITPGVSGYGSDTNHSNGQMIDIASGGAVSNAGACSSGCASAWNASTSITDQTASFSMASFPTNTIAGVPSSGSYPNGNPSLTNSNHQPDFEETVTFTLSGLTGLQSDSAISDVVMNFGTEGGQTEDAGSGYISATPEPGTVSLMFGGAALLFTAVRRRRA